MAIAAAMTLLCHRLKQPAVIGYLLAGLIIGPHTPPFALVQDLGSIHTMAELGLVFLMFALGLEFNLPKLRKVGLRAALAATLEILGMLWIGFELGQFFGWSRMDSIFLGAILSISSTTIIIKVFMDLNMMKAEVAQTVFGILILEDIVAVAILSILSGLGYQTGNGPATAISALLKVGFFVVLFLTLGLMIVPRFLQWVGRFKNREAMGIVTLGLCLGGALLAARFGFSIALGAFLTGAIIAASKEIFQIEEWIGPIRDMFSALFFVSAGMLIEPRMLWDYRWPILAVTLATLLGKAASGAIGSFLAGHDLKTSFKIGVSLAQIGEFSFVIASLGATHKITSPFLYPLAIAVSSLTALFTPYLIRNAEPLVENLMKIMPARVQSGLECYQAWVDKLQREKISSPETAILSRYLIRLIVYGTALLGILFGLQIVSKALEISIGPEGSLVVALFALWLASAVLLLPLFAAISKYANHLILLLVTRGLAAREPSRILKYLDIRLFYNILHLITMCLLGLILLLISASFLTSLYQLMAVALVMTVSTYLMRSPIERAKERLEKLLDEILGLATSEPTRQAILMMAGEKSLFYDLTEQVVLSKNSSVVGKTIKAIGVREKTGASIVAIYSQGTHIANPEADLELLPNDVLVLLGNAEQRQKAKELLG